MEIQVHAHTTVQEFQLRPCTTHKVRESRVQRPLLVVCDIVHSNFEDEHRQALTSCFFFSRIIFSTERKPACFLGVGRSAVGGRVAAGLPSRPVCARPSLPSGRVNTEPPAGGRQGRGQRARRKQKRGANSNMSDQFSTFFRSLEVNP